MPILGSGRISEKVSARGMSLSTIRNAFQMSRILVCGSIRRLLVAVTLAVSLTLGVAPSQGDEPVDIAAVACIVTVAGICRGT